MFRASTTNDHKKPNHLKYTVWTLNPRATVVEASGRLVGKVSVQKKKSKYIALNSSAQSGSTKSEG